MDCLKKSNYTCFFKVKKQDIDFVFKNFNSRVFLGSWILFSVSKTSSFPKFAFLISRKAGNAVFRNKLKRQLRFIFYQQKVYERGKSILFVATKKNKMSVTFDELKNVVDKVTL